MPEAMHYDAIITWAPYRCKWRVRRWSESHQTIQGYRSQALQQGSRMAG